MKLEGPRKSFLLFHSKRPTAFVELKGVPGARRVEDGRGVGLVGHGMRMERWEGDTCRISEPG